MNQRIALAGQYNQTWWGGKEPKKSFFFSSTEIPSRGIKGIAKGKRNRTERIFNDIFLLPPFLLFVSLSPLLGPHNNSIKEALYCKNLVTTKRYSFEFLMFKRFPFDSYLDPFRGVVKNLALLILFKRSSLNFSNALFLYTEMYNLLFGGQRTKFERMKALAVAAPAFSLFLRDLKCEEGKRSLSSDKPTKREKGAASFSNKREGFFLFFSFTGRERGSLSLFFFLCCKTREREERVVRR